MISCPRCEAKLVAPDADDEPVEPATAAAPTPAPGHPNTPTEGGISLESLDIRVEDIRVEPAMRGAYPARTERTIEPDEDRDVFSPASEAAPPPVVVEVFLPATEEMPTVPETVADDPPGPIVGQSPPPVVEPPILPEIQLEPSESGTRSRRAEPPRSYDMVLPRAVVASWSLLVLVAVAFAFLAGLLVGHYVWQVH